MASANQISINNTSAFAHPPLGAKKNRRGRGNANTNEKIGANKTLLQIAKISPPQFHAAAKNQERREDKRIGCKRNTKVGVMPTSYNSRVTTLPV